MEYIKGGVTAPKGFKAAGIHAGIRKNKLKRDLALIVSDIMANAAVLNTTNKVIGAPNTVTKSNLLASKGKMRAIICNSGNANTCNADGEIKARSMCKLTAEKLGVEPANIIVASTGVIGQTLPLEPIQNCMDNLTAALSIDGSDDAAHAIMTTDTVKKEFAAEFTLTDGIKARIGAIAKGSGMIHPNMATMLAFITTDVNITSEMLQCALKDVVDDTFNMISIDGDTSTNDMLAALANGMAGNKLIDKANGDYKLFVNALLKILTLVSKALAKDGEGATKLVTCTVKGAADKKTAAIVAKSVITSNLLKCAIFAADANWGRILCAIGYAKADFDISAVDVDILSRAGCVAVCRGGSGMSFDEAEATKVLSQDEVTISVDLHGGENEATAWGCDLTYDYVKINADYRT